MKKKIGKFFITVLILSLASLSCGKNTEKNATSDKDNTQQVEEHKQNENLNTETESKDSSEREMNYGKGMDEEFTTDGKLHEDKFLNKTFGYPDTADSFKIEKDSEGYVITEYIDESPIVGKEVPVKEDKSRLKIENDVYLVHKDGLVYAYDTKLKKLVLLNKENNFRIIFIINE